MTTRVTRLFIPLFLAIASTAGAFGQSTTAFDKANGDMSLLQVKSVQADISLTPAQRAKLEKLAEDSQRRVEAFRQDMIRKKIDPRSIRFDEPPLSDYYTELRTGVFSVLTPVQITRLRELTIQHDGIVSLTRPSIGHRLGISLSVQKQINSAVESFGKFTQQVSRAAQEEVYRPYANVQPKSQADLQRLQKEIAPKMQAANERIRPQIIAAEEQCKKKVMSLLTPAQRAAWKALQGRPFAGK